MGLFDSLSQYGGALIGGLLGGAGSGSTTTQKTESKDPWAPAQPYMLKNLANESALQDYYQKTPFNAQQQEGYANLFGDISNFREKVAPGLMDFANKGMTSNYQRSMGGAPGSGAGYGAARAAQMQGGMTGPMMPGPFSSNRQGDSANRNPLLDLNGAQNPFANGAIKPAEQKAYEAMSPGGLLQTSRGAGGGGTGATDSNPGWSSMSDANKASYYAANPTMAAITQALQMGFSLTDIASLQAQMEPGFQSQQAAIARGVDPTNMGNGWGFAPPTHPDGVGYSGGGYSSGGSGFSSTGGYGHGQGGFGGAAQGSTGGYGPNGSDGPGMGGGGGW